MALQLWLPLIDSLQNQGIANNIAITDVGNHLTITNDGKLGKCYNFNGSNTEINVSGYYPNSLSTFTIAFWYYPVSTSLQSILLFRGAGAHRIRITQNQFGVRDSNHSSLWTTDFNTFTANKWIHVAAVYNKGSVYLYQDGVLIRSNITRKSSIMYNDIDEFNIGTARSTSGISYATGKINDFRFYDEALSAKQVKEISKGLIVHYPFNWGNANLLKLGAAERECPSQSAIIQHYYFDFTGNLPTATYTLSFDAKNNGTDAAYFSVARENSTQMRIGELHPGHNHYAHYSYTFTTTSTTIDNVFFTAYKSYGSPTNANNTGILYIKNVKLESGNIETPFEIAASEGYTNNNLYDISGYNHNATLSGSGDLLISNTTPRYKSAIGFQASRYYQCVSPSSSVQTIAVWAKWITIPSGQSVIYVDNKSCTGLGLMSTGILTSSQITSQIFDKSSIVANTWYHFVIVCPNGPADSARELYINGVKQTASSSTSNWSFSIDQLNIGKRSSTNDGFNGYLSDFRMYTTALSAADIKELYETSMDIDSAGNINPRVLTT